MNIMHLRLAVVGGIVIVAFGLVSLLGYHNLPVLSFTVGPIDQLHLMAGVAGTAAQEELRRDQVVFSPRSPPEVLNAGLAAVFSGLPPQPIDKMHGRGLVSAPLE